jgi:DNA helicase HerA-like ATPase
MGSGKTLFATALARHYHKNGSTIYANFGLKFPFKPLTMKEISDFNFDFNNSVLIIDEIHLNIDSRSSMSRKNKIISYFITQSRKRNIILIYTTQNAHQIDKRLRTNTDYIIQCRNLTPKAKKDVYIEWTITDPNDQTRTFIMKADPIFKLYDTHQIIDFDRSEFKKKKEE